MPGWVAAPRASSADVSSPVCDRRRARLRLMVRIRIRVRFWIVLGFGFGVRFWG